MGLKALAALMDNMHQEMDRGDAILLIFLNLSLAFDTMSHSILLECHSRLGGTVLRYFLRYVLRYFLRASECSDGGLLLFPLAAGL